MASWIIGISVIILKSRSRRSIGSRKTEAVGKYSSSLAVKIRESVNSQMAVGDARGRAAANLSSNSADYGEAVKYLTYQECFYGGYLSPCGLYKLILWNSYEANISFRSDDGGWHDSFSAAFWQIYCEYWTGLSRGGELFKYGYLNTCTLRCNQQGCSAGQTAGRYV